MTRRTVFAEQALSANNTEFTPDALEQASQNSLSRVLEAYGGQATVQRNEGVPDTAGVDENGRPRLYVSSTGYRELFSDLARMTTLYGNERAQGRDRPDEVLTERQVDQAVLHSFGWNIDEAAIRAGARSIQIEPQTGHNPYKVHNRLQQVLSGVSPVTTHVISRRGDIYTVLPWSKAPLANTSRAVSDLQVDSRSISIDLEAWHTSYNVAAREVDADTFRIVSLMPYTDQQLSALAFLLKKLGLWCSADVTAPLGYVASAVRSKLGNGGSHVPGTVNYSAYATNQPFSPGGEFEFPPGFRLGDTLPSHLQAKQAAWEMRLQRVYLSKGYAPGVPISALESVQSIVRATRDYSFEYELFEEQTGNPIFEAAPPQSPTAAASEVALAAVGAGYARAQAMQSTVRSRLYEASATAMDAMTIAAAELEARLNAQRDARVTAPATHSALCFDFERQMWGYQQVQIVPDPASVTLPPPTGAAAGGGAPTPAAAGRAVTPPAPRPGTAR